MGELNSREDRPRTDRPYEARSHEANPDNTSSLADLMSDGFYMLLLLKRGQLPTDATVFADSIRQFLESVERDARSEGIPAEDIYVAQYAFCAAIDEAILGQPSPLHEEWQRSPLQLRRFGEHLAGEHFFERLDELRDQGAPRLQALEIYYYCLLLGFQGKYRIQNKEKLGYLTARLGDEIAFLKGRRCGFAPHWEPPDHAVHKLRRHMPLWAPVAMFAAVTLGGYFTFNTLLARHLQQQLSPYHDIVQLPPSTAHITITLP